MLKPIKTDDHYNQTEDHYNQTEDHYNQALARVYELMQTEVKEDSAESDELEILSILIKEYETDHYSVLSPNPLKAIKFRLDQMGLSEKN
jgi:HTH-type transcriptional regulator/antitoxin HigA